MSGPSGCHQLLIFTPIFIRVPIKLSPTTVANGTGAGGKQTEDKHVVIGGLISGIAVILAIISGVFFLVRHRRRGRTGRSNGPRVMASMIVEPFTVSTPSNVDRPESQMILPQHLASHILIAPSNIRKLSVPTATLPIPQTSDSPEKQTRNEQHSEEERGVSTNPAVQVDENQRELIRSTGASNAPHDIGVELRRELEDLRREVVRIRREREAVDEAPPIYDSELEDAMMR